MYIDTVYLVDPARYRIVPTRHCTETVTATGNRRYQRLSVKKNLLLTWEALPGSAKSLIEGFHALDTVLAVNIEGETYHMVSYREPYFDRIQGPLEYYICVWELREP